MDGSCVLPDECALDEYIQRGERSAIGWCSLGHIHKNHLVLLFGLTGHTLSHRAFLKRSLRRSTRAI